MKSKNREFLSADTTFIEAERLAGFVSDLLADPCMAASRLAEQRTSLQGTTALGTARLPITPLRVTVPAPLLCCQNSQCFGSAARVGAETMLVSLLTDPDVSCLFLRAAIFPHNSYFTFPCCLCPGVPFASSTKLPLAIVHPAGRDSKIESTCSETRFSRSESRAFIFEGPSHLRPTYHDCAARETLSKRLAVE